MKRFFYLGCLIALYIGLSGCTRQTWIKDLAVPPGTSLGQGQEQLIRLVKINEFRDLGEKFWVAGKGYAQINGGSGAYFWQSSTPPQLEVEVESSDPQALEKCKSALRTGVPAEMVLAVEGKGFFKGIESPQGFLGVFKLESLAKCEPISVAP